MDKSFIGLCRESLSLVGETLPQFATEMKKLTEKDRNDLADAFRAQGFNPTGIHPAAATA